MRSCLCCSLYNGCKWVAGYQFVSACLSIVGIIYSIATGETKSPGMWVLEVILAVMLLALTVGLVFGLKRNNRRLLLIWIITKAVLLALVVLGLIYIIYVVVSLPTIRLDAFNEEHREAICLNTIRSYWSALGQEGRNNGFQVAYHAPPED
ncbi:hypothetical protein BV898_18907 [Hypsibius exemplaris]|uniref:Uncharacterized protein n=1 Tax=Hypsibius exemplaris TaxID=2072580 RepID=A0A9X6NI49_HYPEX|nr:hypothetical protein BV898_18907 [Hypsibius exemplaris]